MSTEDDARARVAYHLLDGIKGGVTGVAQEPQHAWPQQRPQLADKGRKIKHERHAHNPASSHQEEVGVSALVSKAMMYVCVCGGGGG
jgi:hypothetical protein